MTAATEGMLDARASAQIRFDKAILCPRRTDEHLQIVLDRAHASRASQLLTRMMSAQLDGFKPVHRMRIDDVPLSRTAYDGTVRDVSGPGGVCTVAAGTSDAFTFRYHGDAATSLVDVCLTGPGVCWGRSMNADAFSSWPSSRAWARHCRPWWAVSSSAWSLPTRRPMGTASRQGARAQPMPCSRGCTLGLVVRNIDNRDGGACPALRVCGVIDAAFLCGTDAERLRQPSFVSRESGST